MKGKIRKLTLEHDAHPDISRLRAARSIWGEVLDAVVDLELQGETSPWIGVHDFVSSREVEMCRASVNSHARRLHSKEKGWVFQTYADNDEAEGKHSLYIRKTSFKPSTTMKLMD